MQHDVPSLDKNKYFIELSEEKCQLNFLINCHSICNKLND